MPGRLFLTTPADQVAQRLDTSVGDLASEPPRRNIQPGQPVVVFGPDGLTRMRWGVIPVGRINARGRPVMETIINTRSETMFEKSAFSGVGRAAVPADGWYEWTGPARRKTAWRISDAKGGLLFFAAITDRWQASASMAVDQVAIVTCEPNDDVRPIHHRMGVLLEVRDIPLWLSGTEAQAGKLTRPWPEGRLKIEEAEGVDWSAP